MYNTSPTPDTQSPQLMSYTNCTPTPCSLGTVSSHLTIWHVILHHRTSTLNLSQHTTHLPKNTDSIPGKIGRGTGRWKGGGSQEDERCVVQGEGGGTANWMGGRDEANTFTTLTVRPVHKSSNSGTCNNNTCLPLTKYSKYATYIKKHWFPTKLKECHIQIHTDTCTYICTCVFSDMAYSWRKTHRWCRHKVLPYNQCMVGDTDSIPRHLITSHTHTYAHAHARAHTIYTLSTATHSLMRFHCNLNIAMANNLASVPETESWIPGDKCLLWEDQTLYLQVGQACPAYNTPTHMTFIVSVKRETRLLPLTHCRPTVRVLPTSPSTSTGYCLHTWDVQRLCNVRNLQDNHVCACWGG